MVPLDNEWLYRPKVFGKRVFDRFQLLSDEETLSSRVSRLRSCVFASFNESNPTGCDICAYVYTFSLTKYNTAVTSPSAPQFSNVGKFFVYFPLRNNLYGFGNDPLSTNII